MAEIVNLNRHRKAQARQQAERQAEANRVKFGRDKATRLREEQEEARRRALLDGAALEPEKPEPAAP
ncbi:DUF4169 family protein [Pseudoroseomonas wenyumeiae]|uniref:DUF4169 family protein n=1 Tax=Teichococcus wenyumeiae TaxID=2478470 RepID=A0A3A9JQZ1_9PROT|nr:DUF4169 family protein [Pseudoroseomonas wenyumeiae]RKK03058.1 DUF4169 family protein [Pseudoroseomonas wenyumeiae]RMI24794.1 DUF4169 family protein [Pseudoroseomonas wenyumeiae]